MSNNFREFLFLFNITQQRVGSSTKSDSCFSVSMGHSVIFEVLFFFLFPESVSASIIKHQQERCLTHKGSDLSRKKYHHSLQNTFLFSKYLFSSGIPTETNMMPYIKKTRKHPYECLQPKINRQDTLSSCKINVHLKILWINPAFPFVSNFRLRKCPFLLFYVCANSPK